MLKRISAYCCLAVGLAGCFLPLLPGLLFLVVGLKLLGSEHPIGRALAPYVFRRKSKVADDGAALPIR